MQLFIVDRKSNSNHSPFSVSGTSIHLVQWMEIVAYTINVVVVYTMKLKSL